MARSAAVTVIKRSIDYRGYPWPGVMLLLTAVLVGVLLARLPLLVGAALIVGTAVLLLTLIQPLFGLGLALLAGPLGALEQVLLGSSSLDSGQVLLIITLGAWIARKLLQRRLAFPKTFLNPPFLLLLSAAFLTLLGARSAVLGLVELLKWLEMAAVMIMVVDLAGENGRDEGWKGLLSGPPKTVWIVAMLLLAGCSQALVGIWQFGLRGEGPEHFLIADNIYRAAGTFEQPNPFGGFMNLSVLLALGILFGLLSAWALWWRRRGQEPQDLPGFMPGLRMALMTLLVALSAGLCALGLVASWSRGAWMGFGAGAALILFFWPRKWGVGLLLLGIGVLLLLLAMQANLVPAALTSRLAGFAADLRFGDVRGVDINDSNYSVLERLAHWQAAEDMARDNPWLGVGFGNYAAAYPEYALINWPDALGHAHNYYLNLLAEVGVIGLAAYMIFWTAVFWQTLRALRRRSWPGRGIALGLLGVWTALTVHQLVDKLYVNNLYVHLGVLLGLLQLIDFTEAELTTSDGTMVAVSTGEVAGAN